MDIYRLKIIKSISAIKKGTLVFLCTRVLFYFYGLFWASLVAIRHSIPRRKKTGTLIVFKIYNETKYICTYGLSNYTNLGPM
jgi:hypothetical protein